LPQPLGPIMAVTARAWTSIETLLRTWCLPKYTNRFFTVKAATGRAGEVAGAGAGLLSGLGTVPGGFSAFPAGAVLISSGVMVEFMCFFENGCAKRTARRRSKEMSV